LILRELAEISAQAEALKLSAKSFAQADAFLPLRKRCCGSPAQIVGRCRKRSTRHGDDRRLAATVGFAGLTPGTQVPVVLTTAGKPNPSGDDGRAIVIH
jgi:hypothetical protein